MVKTSSNVLLVDKAPNQQFLVESEKTQLSLPANTQAMYDWEDLRGLSWILLEDYA